VKSRYPFLISIPHGGTEVPPEVRDRIALSPEDLAWYCDPHTREIFDFGDAVAARIDTPISRMVVDVNRPPLPPPPRDPDGIIKVRTIDSRPVYREGRFPDMQLIHLLLMAHYFPYHQRIDELIDRCPVRIAFDCHSMLPVGFPSQKDAGKERPLICLANNGDRRGRARKGSLATCPAEWAQLLADGFREEFGLSREVAINNPFSGGFIANAHFWRKGIPWIQIEINRSLYETRNTAGRDSSGETERHDQLRKQVWKILTAFWDAMNTTG
jgi:formiminoglutamase